MRADQCAWDPCMWPGCMEEEAAAAAAAEEPLPGAAGVGDSDEWGAGDALGKAWMKYSLKHQQQRQRIKQ